MPRPAQRGGNDAVTTLAELVETSAHVSSVSGRLAKVSRIAELLEKLDAGEIEIAIGFLTGWPRQNKLGLGWAAVAKARQTAPAAEPVLGLADVDRVFDALLHVAGKNSAAERMRQLNALFSLATASEQRFLGALIVGEVRQGALEGVMLEAIARAADKPADLVRRAAMFAGNLGLVAKEALTGTDDALHAFGLQLFRPVQPMLADSADTIAEAWAEEAETVIEWKIDGARIQVHAEGENVVVYTRNLNDITNAVPEVVEAVRALGVSDLILDGEVIALSADSRPKPFQTTMRRFGRKLDVDHLRAEIPLTPFFFDILRLNGQSVVDLPLSRRLEVMRETLPDALRVPQMMTSTLALAEAFQGNAIAHGHEGVMIKSLDAPYAAGKRGSAWIKVKTARTLDLVILAAEWGSGRRQGWLSNIHLAARDPGTGEFVMLGKTFKGMTDEMLAWQTGEFLAREVRREGHIVYLRPEIVVEVAFNEVQQSSQYPGGVALRFARVKAYRADKTAGEADTIATVQAMLAD